MFQRLKLDGSYGDGSLWGRLLMTAAAALGLSRRASFVLQSRGSRPIRAVQLSR